MKLKYVGLSQDEALTTSSVKTRTRKGTKDLDVVYQGYIVTFRVAKSEKDSYIGEMKLTFKYIPMLELGDWYDLSFIEELL